MSGSRRPVSARWAQRKRARETALQLLYRCEVGRLEMPEALLTLDSTEVDEGTPLDDEGRSQAASLARGAWDARPALDERIGDASTNWRVERMTVLDRQVLRLATHELLAHPETPPSVVLDEAIELSREYSGEEAARFVNGVLDGILRRLRDEGRVVE
jgi:transcription antitermination protein NusB